MLLDLEKEQQLAFNRLKKAYADCKKLKVQLVNEYGELVAYNGKLVVDFGDIEFVPGGHPVSYSDVYSKFYNTNRISNVDPGRADDEALWMFGLSDEGLEIYENE